MQDIGQQMIRMAIRWLPLVVVTALAAGGIAYVYASNQEAVYEASGTLRVDAGPGATTQDYAAAGGALALYALEGGSRTVAQAVIEDLGLDLSVSDLQGRVQFTADEDDLTLEILAQANNPGEARTIALRTGNVLRQNVNASLITSQVRAADQAIRANQSLIDSYSNRLQVLRRKQPKTEDERAEMLSLSSLIPSLRAENIRLQPNSREGVRNRLRWVEPPRSPGASVNRPVIWTLLAMVVGGMLGAALAFVLDSLRRNDRVRDIRDLEEATGRPALGAISEKSGDIRRGPAERLVVLRYPESDVAKAYRGLLTKIGFAASSARSLMVASHDGSSGASVVAANIALAYAESGRTVLLVDADLRSPRLHQLFGVVNDRGLSDLLVDRNVPLGFVTKPSPHQRLGLMLAGPPPSPTAEALGSPVLNALLRRLLHAADVVVFSSPSIESSLDAAALAAALDECILVVPAGASADDIVDAAASFERSKAHFTGAVLHRQVRGAHPRGAAVSLSPPQVQWVPRADPLPDEPRLTAWASAPAQARPHEPRARSVSQPDTAGPPSHAPGQGAPAGPSAVPAAGRPLQAVGPGAASDAQVGANATPPPAALPFAGTFQAAPLVPPAQTPVGPQTGPAHAADPLAPATVTPAADRIGNGGSPASASSDASRPFAGTFQAAPLVPPAQAGQPTDPARPTVPLAPPPVTPAVKRNGNGASPASDTATATPTPSPPNAATPSGVGGSSA